MKVGIISIILAAFILVGFLVLGGESEEPVSISASNSSASQDSPVVAQANGEIDEYSPEKLAKSEAKTNILFFHADWCTVCNAVERNLEAGTIPDDVSILKVNYDSSTGQDLADKYNIPIQYSMVQVDTDGNEITQWVNQSFFTIDDVLELAQT